MARARNIKPGTFKNELLGSMEPLAVLLFISLWTLADREGRIEDRPLRIKAETFPYRENIDINSYLTLLERYGFIERYEAKGIKVIRVVKFLDHQNPHGTEKDSELPDREGFLTVHIRKGNCITGEIKKIPYDNQQHNSFNVKETLSNVNLQSLNALIPDSLLLIPDSLNMNPESSSEHKLNGRSTDVQPTNNHKPRNNNQETITSKKEIAIKPDGVDDTVFADFLKIRKAKRAPLTETAMAGIAREAGIAGITLQSALRICCERGWQSFKADWLKNTGQMQPAQQSQQRSRKELGT